MPCYFGYDSQGNKFHIRGNLGPHCAECADVGINLCDYPVGGGKTCDRAICNQHSNLIAENMHYCNAHFAVYKAENPDLFTNVLTPFKRDESMPP